VTKVPRDYQIAAVEAVWQYFRSGKTGNPIIVMPTGTGKSLVAALLVKSMLYAYPTTRIMLLTHVKELIENNHSTLLEVFPSAPAGIFSAGLNRKDIGAQITYAGIASVAKRARLFQKTDIILIDECHLVSPSESTTYQKFIASLKAFNPNLKVIGMTATPFRMGQGMLTDGSLFDEVCFDLGSGDAFVWLIEQGYLIQPVPKQTETQIDTSGVQVQAGEFVQSALEQSMADQGVIPLALDETIRAAQGRSAWLIFATSIAQVEAITDMLNARGVPATYVHSKMPNNERDARIAGFKSGRYRAMVNRDILTTGFDHPSIDCIVMLRPTRSPGLWVQMLGRGTRPVYAPGFDITTQDGRLAAIATSAKQNCLVLDFASNTLRLGPINYPEIPKKRNSRGGDPPVRICPDCGTYNHISVKACIACGYVFPVEEKLLKTASAAELVVKVKPEKPVKPRQVETFVVDRMQAEPYKKEGRPPSVKVTYFCGTRSFPVWVAPEHPQPFVRIEAKRWWRLHAKEAKLPRPQDAAALLAAFGGQVRAPFYIRVDLTDKYPQVLDYSFSTTGFDFEEGNAA
jgi:DNA repair protein RadD